MHQPLKQEHQRAPEPSFSPGKEELRPHFPQGHYAKSKNPTPLEGIVSEVKEIVSYLHACLKDSYPEQAQANQSKAIEWAHQYVDGEIAHIGCILSLLSSLHNSLCENEFTCSSSQSPSNCMYVGQDFQELPYDQQIKKLLRQALSAVSLPTRQGLPISGYEHLSLEDAWCGYILGLIELLPEQPYIITGTPTNPPVKEELEEPEDDPDAPVGPFRNLVERSSPLPVIRRGLLRNIFRRR